MAASKTPVFQFAEGFFQISTPGADMRLRWCPAPLAEEKPCRLKQWRKFWPDFRILRPESDRDQWNHADTNPALLPQKDTDRTTNQKATAFAAFRNEIPDKFCTIVESFGSHQWALLKLLQAEKTFRDLAKANAILAYCLANNGMFRTTNAKIAEQLAVPHSHSKQREILEWLGFPGTRPTVNLLKKILPAAASPASMRYLREALKRDDSLLQLLAHQKRIGAGVLALACNRHICSLVTPKLLAEIAASGEEDAESPTADCLDHALYLRREMHDGQRPQPFRTRRRIRQFHDDVVEEYETYEERMAARRAAFEARANREKERRKLKPLSRRFIEPPIPGTDTIRPITTALELEEEGKEQNNCVSSYRRKVSSGRLYIYKVLSPERATLSVVINNDGLCGISELKAKANREVKATTRSAVARWLYDHSLSA